MSDEERTLRARVTELQDTLRALQEEAGKLFRTTGWIRTTDEPPPIGLRVLGSRFGDRGWFVRKDDGNWEYLMMNGKHFEGAYDPDFWMVIPPEPDT